MFTHPTPTLVLSDGRRIAIPRGADWAASFAVWLPKAGAAVMAFFERASEARARRALLDGARFLEASDPKMADELRRAASGYGLRS